MRIAAPALEINPAIANDPAKIDNVNFLANAIWSVIPTILIDQVETMIRQRPPAGLRASNGKDGKS